MTHTPAPWQACPDDNGRESTEIRARGSLIANVYGSEDFPCLTDEESDALPEEMLANARLIAAAPDLLEVVRMAKSVAEMELGEGSAPDFGPRELLEAAHAALAKAEGRQ